MSRQQAGKRFETQLCGEIYEATGGDVLPEPIGYSGNHKIPAPDVRIDDGTKVHAIELKDTSKDRISVRYEPDDPGSDDIAQLLRYARDYPRTVVPYIGVNFNNRQLVLTKLWIGAPNEQAILRSATKTTPTDVRVTRGDNLSFHKPETDEWPSAKTGDDARHVLETIGYLDSQS